MSSTFELESYLAKSRSESVSHVALPNELAVESIQAVQRDVIGAMQKLDEQVEKLEVAAKQRYPILQGQDVDMPPRQGRGRQWNSGAQIICRRCNQPEHYARGCAAIMDQQGLRGQGTQGSWHQGSELNVSNMPTVHINNVSSYFVVGEVFETPVSFLADIQGDMWDRLVPENNGMDREVAH